MIDMGAMANLLELGFVSRLGFQVGRVNISVSLTSNQWVVPDGIAVTNLSVGTWAWEAKFVVMTMSRFDVILGMEFLFNAGVHVLPHLSCIWIGGMEEPCTVEC